jgi:hypothetical protein
MRFNIAMRVLYSSEHNPAPPVVAEPESFLLANCSGNSRNSSEETLCFRSDKHWRKLSSVGVALSSPLVMAND